MLGAPVHRQSPAQIGPVGPDNLRDAVKNKSRNHQRIKKFVLIFSPQMKDSEPGPQDKTGLSDDIDAVIYRHQDRLMLGAGSHNSPGKEQAQRGKQADGDNHRMDYRLIFFFLGKEAHPQADCGHRPGQEIAAVKNRINEPEARGQTPA